MNDLAVLIVFLPMLRSYGYLYFLPGFIIFFIYIFIFYFSICLALMLMFDVHRALTSYFPPKRSLIAPVMLPSSTGGSFCTHCILVCQTGQGGVASTPAAHPRPIAVHKGPTGTLFQKSTSPDFLLPSPAPEATVSPDLAGDPRPTAIDRHTCSYQQLEEVLGRFWVPGKLLETKTGQGHFMSGIMCKNHPGLSKDNFSKVESLSYTFNWKSALMGLFPSHPQASTDVQNNYGDMLGVPKPFWSHHLIYQRKVQPFPEEAKL